MNSIGIHDSRHEALRLYDVTHHKATEVSRALIPLASCFPRETKARHLLRITRNGHAKLELPSGRLACHTYTRRSHTLGGSSETWHLKRAHRFKNAFC
jgi:hypothetical protein